MHTCCFSIIFVFSWFFSLPCSLLQLFQWQCRLKSFDGSNNFELWKIKMKGYLAHQGLLDAVEGAVADSPTKSEKRQAYEAIITSLGDDVLLQVSRLKTPAAMWKRLNTVYTKKSSQEESIFLQRSKLESLNSLYGMLEIDRDIESWAPGQTSTYAIMLDYGDQTEAVSMAMSVEKFDGSNNFELRQTNMRGYLAQQGLLGAVKVAVGVSPTESEKRRAYGVIIMSLRDKVVLQLSRQKTAAAVWKRLNTLYTKKSSVQGRGKDAMLGDMRSLEGKILKQEEYIFLQRSKLESLNLQHSQLMLEIDRDIESWAPRQTSTPGQTSTYATMLDYGDQRELVVPIETTVSCTTHPHCVHDYMV